MTTKSQLGGLATVVLGLTLLASGCAKAPPPPDLAGAKFKVPVFGPAEVSGMSTFSHGGSDGIPQMNGKLWELATEESFAAMVRFYLRELQMSAKEDLEDCLVFELTPNGGLPGEMVQISIQKYSEGGKRCFSVMELSYAGAGAVGQ